MGSIAQKKVTSAVYLKEEQVRYLRRQATNAFVKGITASLTGAALLILFTIVGYVAMRGTNSIDLDFFIKEPKPIGEVGGGIAQAILGTLEMVVLAGLIAVPLGLGAAIYLSEIGQGRFAACVRFALDTLAELPSIVIGVFIWSLLVRNVIGNYSGFAGSVALAVIMLPILARSIEEILHLVPDSLREAGLALGMPRWKVTIHIVIPTVLPGITTGIILSMARAAGETAPLILTALGNNFFNFDLLQPMASMPQQIYNYAISPYDDFHRKAFAATLILILVVAILSAIVRIFTGKMRYES